MKGLKYVEAHNGPDGAVRYYFRIGRGDRTRLRGRPGDPEFTFAYAMAFTRKTGKTLPPHLQPPTSIVLRMKAREITRDLERPTNAVSPNSLGNCQDRTENR